MIKIILNNDKDKAIMISNLYRGLDFKNDNEIAFRFELNFNGEYSSASIDYLVLFATKEITDICAYDKNDIEIFHLTNITARIINLYENYSDEGKNGNATILISNIANDE